MASFSFGFSGDDIEQDPNDVSNAVEALPQTAHDTPPPIPARTHDLDELVGKKPTYSTTTATNRIANTTINV